MQILQKLALGMAFFCGFPGAHAQEWSPPRSVRLIVPFTAGGPTDALARHLADALRTQWKEPIIVENRPGAGGNIAAAEVARAEPNGLTLLFGTSPQLAINVSLYRTLNYDPVMSFEPIVLVGWLPNILIINPKVPAKTLTEFTIHVNARPGELFYGSPGNGASSHLAGVLFNKLAGTDLKHVVYKGTGQVLNDLIAGHIDAAFTDVLTAKPQVDAGLIVPIGVTTKKRSAVMRDVPTLDELGLKGFDIAVFFAVVAPKGTPPEITKAINAAFARAIKNPAITAVLDKQGVIRDDDTSAEHFAAFQKAEIIKWREIVVSSGVQID